MHGLRHHYATAGLAVGMPVKVMSQRLGHANTAITSDLYRTVPAMDAEAAAMAAARILGGGSAG